MHFDPRFASLYGYTNLNPFAPTYPMTTPYGYAAYSAFGTPHVAAATGAGIGTAGDPVQALARIEAQLMMVTELLRTELGRRNAAPGILPNHGTQVGYNQFLPQGVLPFQQNHFAHTEGSPIRLRESDSHIFCEIYLPYLTIGDVEVDVNGNRITCRTRVPLMPQNRWAFVGGVLPRGIELFELPDGRIECSWLCPVPFNAKEVEASFRDGFLCVCVQKTETVGNRHSIKIAKETRRAANDMNS